MNIPYRNLIYSCLFILLVSIPNLVKSQEKMNVLFIAIDDMKPLIAEYGYDEVITPNLDKLMGKSVVFNNAYCQFPVCGPSRASIMTGLRPETNGILDLKTKMREVNPNALTIPQHFKNNGYQTVGRGKIFDPRCVKSRKEDDPESWTIPFKQTHGKADKYNKYGRIAVKMIDEPEEDFTDSRICNESIELLKQLSNDSKPFFLAVGFKKPHLPFLAPKKYFDLYDKEKLEINSFQDAPKNSNPKYVLNNNGEMLSYTPTPIGTDSVQKYKPFKVGGHINELQQRELLQGYYACVSFIDAQIGKLLDELKKSGKEENTIIVLWGDHGFHLGDHGLWGKHSTMEQSARVPFMISIPETKPFKTNSLAELTDVFPTLCELTGLEIPSQLEGVSQVNVINQKGIKARDKAITQYKRNGAYGYSMRTEKYRYTEWVMKDGKTIYSDLYDMINDPLEMVNILPDNKEIGIKLAKQMRENNKGLLRLKKK